MRREVGVQMRHTIAEDVEIDDLGAGRVLQRAGAARQGRAKGRGLRPVELGDVAYVTLRFEIGEAGDFRRQADGQPPMRVLPDLDPLKLRVGGRAAAHRAIGCRHRTLPSDTIGNGRREEYSAASYLIAMF